MKDFEFITNLIKEKSGIVLGEDKAYLVEGRLKPIARKNNFDNIDELITKIKTTRDQALTEEVIDAMTTNESLFFRDTKPFEQLKEIILPKFQNRPLKIWSAAASTGQEIYSTVITLEEQNFLSYKIIGTDLSPSVIERAKEGKYTQFEIQRGMPITLLLKYFRQDGDSWLVNDNVKRNVNFEQMNLLDSYDKLGKFDIIFCRNVLIYFDDATKTAIYEKLYKSLNPEGFLILGSSESSFRFTDKFETVDGATGLFTPKKP